MTNRPERHIPLEGASNLRDLGGFSTSAGHTAFGRVYRSDALTSALTPADHDRLVTLGLRTVVDIRHASELALVPNAFADHPHIRYHHNPIRNFDPVAVGAHLRPRVFDLFEANLGTLRDCGDTFAVLFHLLADATNLPLVFHCASGRDRTGVGSALILEAAGVSRDDIAADYVASNAYLAAARLVSRQRMRAEGLADEEIDAILKAIELREEYILTMLDALDAEFGGIRAYLASHGLAEAELDSFLAGFIERPEP